MGDLVGEFILRNSIPNQGEIIGERADTVHSGKLQDPRQVASLQKMISEMDWHTGTITGNEHAAMGFKPQENLGV